MSGIKAQGQYTITKLNDGTNSYIHIKYSNNGSSFTTNNGDTPGAWIGILINENPQDSTVFGDYAWTKLTGEDGADGTDGSNGLNSYMYIKYSPNADGSNMTDAPEDDTKFIGICTTHLSTAPTNYTAYRWSEFTRKENITASFIRETINSDSMKNLTHYVLDAHALTIVGGAFIIRDAVTRSPLFSIDEFGCLLLSSPASDINLRLVNDMISFETGTGDKIAHISSDNFLIRDGVINNSLRLGKFIFNPRSNDNLSLEWRE